MRRFRWSVSLLLVVTMVPSGISAQTAACGRLTTFADGIAPTRELHVRVNGSDTTGNGSVDNPFASVTKAASQATPGTAIRVHAGTYQGSQFVENLNGTATAPIWIGGAPGETAPVYSGEGVGFLFTKVRYLVIHDMEIQFTSSHGINIFDDGINLADSNATRWVVFRNLNIHDTGGQCLKMAGVNDFWVYDSRFATCSVVNIDGVGVHNGLIANSIIGPGGYGVQMKGGSYNIELRWNRITNNTFRAVNFGGSSGFEFFRPPLSTTSINYEARDMRAVANIIEDSTAPVTMAGCIGCYVVNNTIVNPHTFVFRILQETTSTGAYQFAPSSNGLIFNNLIYFNRPDIAEFVNVGPDTASTTFQIRNNLWYAYNNPAQSTPSGLPVPESGGIYGQNPNFVSLDTGNYSISAASPAARAGVTVGSLFDRYAKGDFAGSCWAVPPSIGAFEATTGPAGVN